MNKDALRSGKVSSGNSIGDHKEHSGADFNKPYRNGFIIDTKNKSKCPTGWRIPNQRELILILGNLTTNELKMNEDKNSNRYIGSCTLSDLKVKDGLYYTVNSNDNVPYMTISASVNRNIYRCVKDIQ